MDGNEECLDRRGGQAAGDRERGGDGARAGRLALMSLRGESMNSIFIYNTIYISLTKAATPRGHTD